MINNEENLKSIKQKLEEAENRLTISEKNLERVNNLRTAEEGAISYLQLQKADLTKSVEELTKTKADLTSDIDNLNTNKAKVSDEITAAQNTVAQSNTTLQNTNQIIDAKKGEFNALIQSITDREDIVSKRETQVAELEKAVINKHNAIKAFATNL